MNRITISLRLTLWFGLIFLAGWVLFGAAMWLNLKHTLTDERHTTLSRRMDRLEQLLVKTAGESTPDRNQDFKDFAHATGNGLAKIFRADGSLAYPSPSAAATRFPWPSIRADREEQFLEVNAADQPYWVLVRRCTFGDQTLYLAGAAPAAGNLLVLGRFWEGLLASAPLLLLVSSIGGYWLSRRALEPVDRITHTARSISIRNLSERLPESGSADELARLTETFNAMLARLESAVNQIKQFTADASHELRGPLSFVRTVSEVALRNPAIDADSRQSFEDIVEEVGKASALLEDMLTLARADAEREGASLAPLDIARVVTEACERAAPLAAERNLTLSVSPLPPESVRVLGDFDGLRRLVWILLDNALKYTHTPGNIRVDLLVSAGKAAVRVVDSGIGIPAADLPHVFNRFYRADPSRSQTEGAGLGLAIAKWIANLHHADLELSSEVSKGTTAQLILPTLEA